MERALSAQRGGKKPPYKRVKGFCLFISNGPIEKGLNRKIGKKEKSMPLGKSRITERFEFNELHQLLVYADDVNMLENIHKRLGKIREFNLKQIKRTIYKKPCLKESQLLAKCLVSLRLNSILFRQSLMLADKEFAKRLLLYGVVKTYCYSDKQRLSIAYRKNEHNEVGSTLRTDIFK
ncbi:hypothetical protein ANN_09361 [Periplaneta americana]|uniref:Uncharacterized protein n=1 Tax=Periplaneta americana TaxID=6978 RepID=A0ABQ8TL72_PERAM|nr:hypothetical protein ANN_09361 [Periplaneta americana]